MVLEKCKILFILKKEDWPDTGSESMWAEKLTHETYKILNSPFHVYGVSFEDIVCVHMSNEELIFQKVIKHSGHSTYRLVLETKKRHLFREYWQPIEKEGSSYEGGPIISIDIPPTSDIHKIYSLLEKGERDGVWEFEEAHCGHPAVVSKN